MKDHLKSLEVDPENLVSLLECGPIEFQSSKLEKAKFGYLPPGREFTEKNLETFVSSKCESLWLRWSEFWLS